ncbi:transcriptional regulator [Mycolicibacterium sp. (ex Dasyatis americana)]|uniref:TetR family transcriptional regulator n=1 Tax=Mycobacterium syngnathidarum TaxID=1908205 RepID=A0A1Q9WAJ7_9MYCO|nr:MULTISPECIES: helix-turn-helix domain-containing protein [Mycobacterium]OFB42469.1 transcriptional regulator [Mycolicibacterium sp. (ex Dasyatis americana)]OHT97863.1 TetR family transcriptional regulator [Mycobacterium syngnathidarum]OLT95828.1 TetR family transcriptional regulator [Mycobacterium syngnathidarum]
MPRPRTLTTDAIFRAALTVLDRDGFSGMSMRAVAAELRVSPMALYRYVDNREQLEELIVEQLLAPIDCTVPTGRPWMHRVEVLMDRLRTAIGAHPAAIPLLLSHRHKSLASLRWIESMLTVLNEAGLAGKDRAIAQRSLVSYLLGSLSSQHSSALSGPGTASMATLSDTEFPHVVETARTAQCITPDDEFHLGLAALLRGLKPD